MPEVYVAPSSILKHFLWGKDIPELGRRHRGGNAQGKFSREPSSARAEGVRRGESDGEKSVGVTVCKGLRSLH